MKQKGNLADLVSHIAKNDINVHTTSDLGRYASFATPQIRIMALSYQNDHHPRSRYGMMDRVPSKHDFVSIYPCIVKTLLVPAMGPRTFRFIIRQTISDMLGCFQFLMPHMPGHA